MMSHTSDAITLEFGEEDEFSPKKTYSHPIAVFFHLIFRILAFLTFLLCGIFNMGFIASFVLIVILHSMDFWTVKNITGRLLVGLRWWNHIDDDGNSQWVFEARKGAEKGLVRTAESRIFWLSLVATEVVWVFFLLWSITKPGWFVVVLVGVILNGANLYGYVRCKVGSGKSVKDATTSFLSKQMFKSMFQAASNATSTPSGTNSTS